MDLNASEWAAWVQAVGSLLAVAIVAVIDQLAAARQRSAEKRNLKEREAARAAAIERAGQALRNAALAVRAVHNAQDVADVQEVRARYLRLLGRMERLASIYIDPATLPHTAVTLMVVQDQVAFALNNLDNFANLATSPARLGTADVLDGAAKTVEEALVQWRAGAW